MELRFNALTDDVTDVKDKAAIVREELAANTRISKATNEASQANRESLLITNDRLAKLKEDTELSVTLSKSIKAWGIVFGALASTLGVIVAMRTMGWL